MDAQFDQPVVKLASVLDHGIVRNKSLVVFSEMDTRLLSRTVYDVLKNLALEEVEELSSKLIAGFYGTNNWQIKLEKLKELSADDSVQMLPALYLMNVLGTNIERLQKVSNINLFSYSPASDKTQVKTSPPNFENYPVWRKESWLKLGEGSGTNYQGSG